MEIELTTCNGLTIYSLYGLYSIPGLGSISDINFMPIKDIIILIKSEHPDSSKWNTLLKCFTKIVLQNIAQENEEGLMIRLKIVNNLVYTTKIKYTRSKKKKFAEFIGNLTIELYLKMQ